MEVHVVTYFPFDGSAGPGGCVCGVFANMEDAEAMIRDPHKSNAEFDYEVVEVTNMAALVDDIREFEIVITDKQTMFPVCGDVIENSIYWITTMPIETVKRNYD